MKEPSGGYSIIDVSTRLRQLRSERNLSMRTLARRSGLSTNALSMIERGRTSPSVSTLYKIAGALEVPITAFFRLEPVRQDVVFLPADARTCIHFPSGTWESLGGEQFTNQLEPFMLTLESGGSSGTYGILHSGHEFVHCLEGKIEYEVDGCKYLLNPGDSLIFSAQLHHKWTNIEGTPAQALIVLAGFEQGESPGEFHATSGFSGEGA